MLSKFLFILVLVSCTACVVVPETVRNEQYQCALSTDKKVLRLINLVDGNASFYQWEDEFFAFITVPTSAVISGSYVLVNNIFHLVEKTIKCN